MSMTATEEQSFDFFTVLDLVPERRIVNGYHRGPVTLEEYKAYSLVDLERDVGYAAAFLDEHVLDWHTRITRPLALRSCHDCVLGQVFAARPRNRFGREKRDGFTNGYSRGLNYLEGVGYIDKPYVFTANRALPFWETEIKNRSGE